LERSKELIKKAKEVAAGVQTLKFEEELMEDIGYRNSSIKILDSQIEKNLKQVQQQNDIREISSIEKPAGINIGLNLTIEMETGTGKTYTYIRTMYELNYNSKRPQDIENFASDSRISVMIINTQAFAARGNDALRIYQELDQFGSRKPIEIISQTNPIIFIDEPQSIMGDWKKPSKSAISMQEFKPLCTIRYSATHKKEYNKIYRLDALDAYNRKLVKKIQVKGISLKGSTGTSGYLYLEHISLRKEQTYMNSQVKCLRTRIKRSLK